MFNWLRKKLGIVKLEKQLQGHVSFSNTRLDGLERAVGRVAKKTRTGKGPQRYDEIERARARRRRG